MAGRVWGQPDTHRDFLCLGLTPEGACKPQIVTKEEMSKGRRERKSLPCRDVSPGTEAGDAAPS